MSKTGINKRNGDIDFLRFFFAIGIVIFHFGITFHKTGFSHGYIGVEFFFIVTGYLMAMHVNNLNQKRESITGVGNETWIFIINKIKQFYKYYICVILIQIFVIDLLIHRMSFGAILTMVFKGIPNYLLVYMGLNFGSEGFSITGMWYLSSMIIALFLLYPLVLKKYDFAVKWLYPVLSLFILGYLYHSYATISNWTQWSGIMFNGILRAVAEIAFGASLFALSRYVSKKYSQNAFFTGIAGKTILTILKVVCFGSIFVFAYGSFKGYVFERDLDLYFFFILAFGIMLSFSNAGFCLPDCKITRLLSKFSLGIYIFHHVGRTILSDFFKDSTLSAAQYCLFLLLTILSCILFTCLTDLVTKLFHHCRISMNAAKK